MAETNPQNLNLELSTLYYQQDTLETDLWFRVATRDYTELINAFDFCKLFSNYPPPIELLDVGCGTGKFPSMLSFHLPQNLHVQYDYLDPSQHSLNELTNALPNPFTPRTALKTTLETLEPSICPSQSYQIIWCLQSLYCVQRETLSEIVKKLHTLLNPSDGLALIYLASSDAFYHRLYNLYNQEFYPDTRQPYITAENITMTLNKLGIQYGVKKLHFPHTIACAEQEILENYVNQCVFDSRASSNLRKTTTLNEFLESFSDEENYRFPQQVWLILFGAKAQTTRTYQREFMI